MTNDDSDGMTYADAGVDIEASEVMTVALAAQVGGGSGDYADLLDIGGRYLGLATDGVGTKLLVAEALDDYSTVGIDCIAMNANDLVTASVRSTAFVDYLAVDTPDETFAKQVGQGLAVGAEEADIELAGGETTVIPEVINGLDLAGTCAGLTKKDAIFPDEAEEGDALVGFPSSGIHSNSFMLARKATTADGNYDDDWDGNDYDTVGEALLEPTRLYTYLLDDLRTAETSAAAHVTGGGQANLERTGEFRYVVDDAFDPQPVFEFAQERGGVSDEEMHTMFNMGTGFAAAVPEENAEALVEMTGSRAIGCVEAGDSVSIRGLDLQTRTAR